MPGLQLTAAGGVALRAGHRTEQEVAAGLPHHEVMVDV
jgi:hypothetical protein